MLKFAAWLFVLLLFSGVALTLYDMPVYRVSAAVPAGTGLIVSGAPSAAPIVRGLHFWFAQIALIAAFAALCRAFFVKTNWPRAGWAAGLFVLTGLLWFTGMLLPWDQLNFWLAPMFRPPTGLLVLYWLHTLILSVPLLVLQVVYVRRLRSTYHETHS